ncbi:MAG: hypothetical protein ACRDP6_06250 [Actinoallomurus sp.]
MSTVNTILAVIALGPEWWVAPAIAALVLYAVYHHTEHRHSPYREDWR